MLFIAGISTIFSLNSCTLERNFEAEKEESAIIIQSQGSRADIPYVATPPQVVDAMLKLAEVNSNDVVYDFR
ncbi:hypothetical protein [Nostoc commune]|uniref:hypothetical protein n=1 Tax=Nostoc commune TaxID=1178 RepID=UPI002B21E9CD|nr:hypothetical protein [Nostoc commune]